MVRLLAASASLTLAFAARISLKSAADLDLDESVVSSETVVAQWDIWDRRSGWDRRDIRYCHNDISPDAPIQCCQEISQDPSRDGRRRGRRDCGCNRDGRHECFPDDEGDYCDHWVTTRAAESLPCDRRHSAPRPVPAPPRPPPPPPPPPEYSPGSGRFWEIGSHQSSGNANWPGTVANGWYDPNSDFILAQNPPANHDGEPYPLAAMTRHDSHDPHHCNSGWALCCNTEFNCCANCPLQNADRPEWGPRGWSQCLGWFPQCGTDAPHPNMPTAPPAPPPGEGGFPGFGGMPGFGGDGGMPGFGGDGGMPGFGMPGFGGDGGMPGFGGGGGMPGFGGGGFGGGAMPAPPPAPPPPSTGGFGGGGFGGGGFGGGGMPGFGGGGMQGGGGFGGFGGFR